MITPEKRLAVQAKIAGFMKDPNIDLSKVTCQQAYEQLYPDDVEFSLFSSVWQHIRNPPEIPAAAATVIDAADSAPASDPPASVPAGTDAKSVGPDPAGAHASAAEAA